MTWPLYQDVTLETKVHKWYLYNCHFFCAEDANVLLAPKKIIATKIFS